MLRDVFFKENKKTYQKSNSAYFQIKRVQWFLFFPSVCFYFLWCICRSFVTRKNSRIKEATEEKKRAVQTWSTMQVRSRNDSPKAQGGKRSLDGGAFQEISLIIKSEVPRPNPSREPLVPSACGPWTHFSKPHPSFTLPLILLLDSPHCVITRSSVRKHMMFISGIFPTQTLSPIP